MKRDTHSNKNNHVQSEKSFHELGAQPRRSDARVHKYAQDSQSYDDDEKKSHHSHRNEPNKNHVRVQLRRIERLYH
ncbi:hypothetical protein [Cellvibrio sp. UBA7671]|uniref:hypothetical protein n=1 Tax=Cellvibrio sp. UBA7671 TaxID=1946312 RepID=UPI002F359A11